jgi:hypothetical protein
MATSALLGTDDTTTRVTRSGEKEMAGLADLADLARGLCGLADVADRIPTALPQVERGFREMADLAQECGEKRIHRIAIAFAAILGNAYRAPREDLPFILETAAAYLEALPGKLARARGKKAT